MRHTPLEGLRLVKAYSKNKGPVGGSIEVSKAAPKGLRPSSDEPVR